LSQINIFFYLLPSVAACSWRLLWQDAGVLYGSRALACRWPQAGGYASCRTTDWV